MQAKPTIEAVAMLGRPVSTAYADGVPGRVRLNVHLRPCRRAAAHPKSGACLIPRTTSPDQRSSGLPQVTSVRLTSDVDRTAAIAQQSSRQN